MTVRALCVSFVLLSSTALAHSDPLSNMRVTPEELKWERAPTGNDRANIVGDDRTAGIYVYRARFAHPDQRIVTVLSGTLYMGYGYAFDEGAMKVLPAGSIWTEPAKEPHYVWAKEGEVIIQVFGANGPSGVTRVEPK